MSKVKKKSFLAIYGQDIVMAFSPSVVGSLVKKGLQKGGVTGTPGPPGYALDLVPVRKPSSEYVGYFILRGNENRRHL